MSGNLSDCWAPAGRRPSESTSFGRRSAIPLGNCSRGSAAFFPCVFSSGRRVGDRPHSGKETGLAWVWLFGS